MFLPERYHLTRSSILPPPPLRLLLLRSLLVSLTRRVCVCSSFVALPLSVPWVPGALLVDVWNVGVMRSGSLGREPKCRSPSSLTALRQPCALCLNISLHQHCHRAHTLPGTLCTDIHPCNIWQHHTTRSTPFLLHSARRTKEHCTLFYISVNVRFHNIGQTET